MPRLLRQNARCRTMRHSAVAFAALCLGLSIGTVGAQTADSDWILKALARPAPMRTDFVEVRDSPLLKAPLRLSGEYRRPREDTLVREVRAPYRETTTIATSKTGPGEATIVR